MTQLNNEDHEKLSIGNSQTEIFEFFLPKKVSSFHGCVVQICPVMPQCEMFRLLKQRTVIGRELACDIVLNDNAVSRSHAAIDLSDMQYFLTDLGSRNGTFVDDEMLQQRRRLRGGEQIRLGGTILKFMESVDKEASYHDVVNSLMARDPLTNSFNRSFMTSTLAKLLASSQFSKHSVALIMIDIDHFKKVNDTKGHLVGDEVLRVFTERILHILRAVDSLCRVGGEEFVVICERTDLKDAVRIAERIRLTVSSTPLSTQSGPVSVTCSLGVMTLDEANFATIEDLLSGADARMYTAKASGRNCVRSSLDQ